MLRRALLALSLANLAFFSVWEELLTRSPFQYFLDGPRPWTVFGAAMANVGWLAAVFLLVASLARRARVARWRGLAFGCAALLVSVVILSSIQRSSTLLTYRALIISEMISACLIAVAAVRWPAGLARVTETALLVLSPFVAITFGQALWGMTGQSAVDRELAGRWTSPVPTAHAVSRRVVWVVFDELDYQLTFDERPEDLRLPEFDRLRAQAVFATQAVPVAGETSLAMTALTIGRPVVAATPVGVSTLRVTLAEDRRVVDWAAQPSIFAKAHAAGSSAGVVGFHHPYCRIFRGSLNACASLGADLSQVWRNADEFTLTESVINQVGVALGSAPGAGRFNLTEHFLDWFRGIRAKRDRMVYEHQLKTVALAKQMASDPALDLVLIHLPIPHPPFFFDRHTGQFSTHGNASYLDNLALADRALGELRRSLEDAGQWVNTAVLVMSDHWYRGKSSWRTLPGRPFGLSRPPDHRVPMLLKLPGQTAALEYTSPFNTVIVHDLILALLESSNLFDPAAMVRWLDQRGSMAPPLCDELKHVDHVCVQE